MDDARITHVVEQLGAFLVSDVAPALAAYYRKLVEEGVPESVAAMLVVRMQDRISGER